MFITLSPACFPFVPLLSTISSFLNLFFKVGFPFFSFIEALFSRYESESEVAQSCPTLCDPIDCSLPGYSVHGIFQATVLVWGAIAFSKAALSRCSQSNLPSPNQENFFVQTQSLSYSLLKYNHCFHTELLNCIITPHNI